MAFRLSIGKPNDYLPPELRKAGLLAHQSVAKGKCFGPFRGHFSKVGKKSDDNYSLVCKVKETNMFIQIIYKINKNFKFY